MILVVDYGGQYVHRIWRTLKYLGAASEIAPKTESAESLLAKSPEAFILSGGPASVSGGTDFGPSQAILDSGVPVLGICFGHQLIAHLFGGEVKEGEVGEYAEVEIEVLEENDLFKGLPKTLKVWASHRDEVASVPEELTILAKSSTCPAEALKHKTKPVYGVQFHPEVEHTPEGPKILKNFLEVSKVL